MRDLLFIPSALIYLAVIGLLFIYGINYFYLTFTAWKASEQEPVQAPFAEWPRVTVQLPIYNERYVARRLILAAAAMDYPLDLLEIQVLDDSTDDTVQIVSKVLSTLQRKGVQIEHIRRQERTGFKAGALANGFRLSKGSFLAIFDADFIPNPDFLKSIVPHFHDPKVGFVQARWDHANRSYSMLTLVQSLMLDGHFVIEQHARSRSGYWFNFNGTAGVWRRETIEQAGGWKAETLTEDLDLSYRSFLLGWQARYIRRVSVPAELPVSFNAYRKQQHRWVSGSLECALRFLPSVWQADLPLRIKIQATFHLTGNVIYLLLFVLSLLYPLILYVGQGYSSLIELFGIGVVFNVTTIAPTLFFGAAQFQLGRREIRLIPAILFASIFGSGMMLNTCRAALQVLGNKKNVFERTPKFGITHRRQTWTHQKYQLRLDRIVFAELTFALFNLGTVLYAVYLRNWIIAGYALIYATGLFLTSGMTIYQSFQLSYQQR